MRKELNNLDHKKRYTFIGTFERFGKKTTFHQSRPHCRHESSFTSGNVRNSKKARVQCNH